MQGLLVNLCTFQWVVLNNVSCGLFSSTVPYIYNNCTPDMCSISIKGLPDFCG